MTGYKGVGSNQHCLLIQGLGYNNDKAKMKRDKEVDANDVCLLLSNLSPGPWLMHCALPVSVGVPLKRISSLAMLYYTDPCDDLSTCEQENKFSHKMLMLTTDFLRITARPD